MGGHDREPYAGCVGNAHPTKTVKLGKLSYWMT
jgi:hypothetical protein